MAVSGAKVDAKRVPGGRPLGPIFGFFWDLVSRSILGHLSYETPEVCGGLGEPPGSLNLRGSATNFTRQRSPSRGAANPVGFAQTAVALKDSFCGRAAKHGPHAAKSSPCAAKCSPCAAKYSRFAAKYAPCMIK